jgi:hypothetical protein
MKFDVISMWKWFFSSDIKVTSKEQFQISCNFDVKWLSPSDMKLTIAILMSKQHNQVNDFVKVISKWYQTNNCNFDKNLMLEIWAQGFLMSLVSIGIWSQPKWTALGWECWRFVGDLVIGNWVNIALLPFRMVKWKLICTITLPKKQFCYFCRLPRDTLCSVHQVSNG